MISLEVMESLLKYRPSSGGGLTTRSGTPLGGQFDWGGRLQKDNGGFQRSAQREWQPREECSGISGLDWETDRSSRCESRAK